MLHNTTDRKHEPIKEDCGITIVLIILGNIKYLFTVKMGEK